MKLVIHADGIQRSTHSMEVLTAVVHKTIGEMVRDVICTIELRVRSEDEDVVDCLSTAIGMQLDMNPGRGTKDFEKHLVRSNKKVQIMVFGEETQLRVMVTAM